MRTDSIAVSDVPNTMIDPDLGFLEIDRTMGEVKSAQEALWGHSVIELRDLVVGREGRSLVITGRVMSFYHKQLAQETVRPHINDLRLSNQVCVVPRHPR